MLFANKYEEIKTLGEGSYGKAILCKRKRDGRFFVLKEIRMSNLSQKDRDDALNESNLLSSLSHPYIIKYEESFQERGNFYIVMEYADGGDLAGKIRIRSETKALFTESEILHTFIQISLAIKYIHDRKILHRDLKAQNIFLMKDGTVKLGDFGIARVLENTFQLCKTRIGTPYYLSPEICEGKTYNSKTDIWSLGCILYELCTLKHAFNARNMSALVVQIIRGKYEPISSTFSADLKQLISRMLTMDQKARPSINGVLNTPILKSRLHLFLNDPKNNSNSNNKDFKNRSPAKKAIAQPVILKSSVSEMGGIQLEKQYFNMDKNQALFKQKENDKARELRQRQIDELLKRRKEEQQRKRKAEEEEMMRLKQEYILKKAAFNANNNQSNVNNINANTNNATSIDHPNKSNLDQMNNLNKNENNFNKNVNYPDSLDTIGRIRHNEFREARQGAIYNKMRNNLGGVDFNAELKKVTDDSFLKGMVSDMPEWAPPPEGIMEEYAERSKILNSFMNENRASNRRILSPIQSDSFSMPNSPPPELSASSTMTRTSSEERRRKLLEQKAAAQANWQTIKEMKTVDIQAQELSLMDSPTKPSNSTIKFTQLGTTNTNTDNMINNDTNNDINNNIKATINSNDHSNLNNVKYTPKTSISPPTLPSLNSGAYYFGKNETKDFQSIVKENKNDKNIILSPKISPSKVERSFSMQSSSSLTSKSRLAEFGLDPNLAKNESDRKILMELDLELSNRPTPRQRSKSRGDFSFKTLLEKEYNINDPDNSQIQNEQHQIENFDNETNNYENSIENNYENVAPRPLIQMGMVEAKNHVTQIHSLVSSIKSVLNLPNETDDTEDEFEIPSTRPISHDLINKEVKFPIVSDSDSLMYRAEAMRAFLERELGLDEFISLRHEISNQNSGLDVISKFPNVIPGIIVILQQLLVLEHLIDDM
ncbi:hypothetical protein TRFO_13354 [Tritrichomonas foetus]|uniref:non-specific serine/threonine protein kinase n=1 Tax=Tritrichomonas foetus TaxID=1144522 RepID=A0A1J4KY83_9EUKA|nr:hypothetical protein TRFO_13354 [Tritrichomonas foetus]|eukprot:OHT16199.1 hypothetical protein TRFO_13354 [Tritrichomonas foetus]